jgi:hypothetical protein
MGKAREAKAFAEFQRGMRELGLAVGHPVEVRGVRQSPRSKEYKKRGCCIQTAICTAIF